MLISIIIPVFNTEEYLNACLESILSQSFADFEVLLIDDGSKDGSGEICEAYARKDSRIRVFHKDNGGVSSARNLGLEYAEGEWVYFVDSDDELFPNGLQTMVNCISDEVDIVLGGYERYEEDGRIYRIDDRIVTILEKEESLSTLYETHGKYYDYLPYGCIRLLRNSIIKDFNLKFDTNLRIKEDTLFITQYICRSNGITRFTTTPVYKYNRRGEGAMERALKGFSYQYIDSLSALIAMKKEIARFYSPFSNPVFIAEEGIWRRYSRIVSWMGKVGLGNKTIQKKIKKDIYKELGLYFFVRESFIIIKRKWFN